MQIQNLLAARWICIFTAVLMWASCKGGRGADHVFDLEIAPGKWVEVEEKLGEAWFRIRWKGELVYWSGEYKEGGDWWGQPVLLRAHEQNLYFVYLEIRPDAVMQYRYCVLDEKASKFVEVGRQYFPKQVAIENLWMLPEIRGEGTKRFNYLEIIRKLDVESDRFLATRTADIWCDLETGSSYVDLTERLSRDDITKIMLTYLRKYRPIPLAEILRKTKIDNP